MLVLSKQVFIVSDFNTQISIRFLIGLSLLQQQIPTTATRNFQGYSLSLLSKVSVGCSKKSPIVCPQRCSITNYSFQQIMINLQGWTSKAQVWIYHRSELLIFSTNLQKRVSTKESLHSSEVYSYSPQVCNQAHCFFLRLNAGPKHRAPLCPLV